MRRTSLRAAVASGNWSNPSIWNNGVLPGPNDLVALNGYNVTLDQDINVAGITNDRLIYSSYNTFEYMTWNDAPEGIADSSVGDYRSYLPYSGGTATDVYVSYDNPGWFSYEYPNQEPIIIHRYSFNVLRNHPYDLKDWKFQGWDNDTQSWEDLDTVTNYTNHVSNTYLSAGLTYTKAYYKYRIIVYQVRSGNGIARFQLFKFYGANTYADDYTGYRGTVTVSDSKTITIGEENISGYPLSDVLSINTPSEDTVTINGNIRSMVSGSDIYASVNISGTGTYNIYGNTILETTYASYSTPAIIVSDACLLNIYGDLNGNGSNTAGRNNLSIKGSGGSTINIFGDVRAGGNYRGGAVDILAPVNLNVYGNVYAAEGYLYGGPGIYCTNSLANINIVGNVYGANILPTSGSSQDRPHGIILNSVNSLEITGNVYGGTYWPTSQSIRYYGIYCRRPNYINIIGTIQAGDGEAGLYASTSVYEIDIYGGDYQLSGPFVHGPTGISPYYIPTFKIISNIGSYYQFRDLNLNTTNMVSPSSIIDLPIPSDVRGGTSYGSGNYVGTIAIPPANRVSAGVPVDNTVGTGTVTAEDIWNYATSAMNTDGSIGKRLKNASTVDSTGDQLSSLL